MTTSKTITAMIITLLTVSSFNSCQSAADKNKAAQEKVEDAKEDLKQAQKDASEASKNVADEQEWATFKADAELQIKTNQASIDNLKIKMKSSGKIMDASYEKRIDVLEAENNALEVRITDYEKNQSDWESFKREFNHDMDELGQSIKDLGVDNKN